MLSYQNTLSPDLSERSQPRLDWISIEEIDALFREKSMLSQTNFSKSLLPNLMSSTDKFVKCAETPPRSGVFYDLNAHQSGEHIKSEECIDLDRLLYDNSDESAINTQSAALAAIADDIGLCNNFTEEQHRNKGVVNTDSTNPFIFNKSNNNIINNNNDKDNNIHINNCDSNDCYSNTVKYNNNSIRSGYQSTNPSASQSPTNVFSMEASPGDSDYYILAETDLTCETSTFDCSGNIFEPLFYDNMPMDDNIFCTPDNSCGPVMFPNEINNSYNNKVTKQPPLTLNLKNTFITDEEINTPNIIDSIMEASEEPLLIMKEKFIKEESQFITTALQDFTPCPSTSPSIAVCDTTDGCSTTSTEPHTTREPRRRRPGRPRKRRYTSDDERGEDDETYVPPTHLRRKIRESRAIPKKQIIYEDISEDDEEDYKPPRRKIALGLPIPAEEEENRLDPVLVFDDEEIKIAGKRGRPPKHARSISSDDYSLLDPEEAKYREMRDRNNEASRKSRYKRKKKEMLMTDELEDLEMENVKLKAQVDELQKTVETYRDNLMKVMLHKS